MTTTGDAIKSALSTNWAAGSTPTFDTTEDVKNIVEDANDRIIVLTFTYTKRERRVNDSYNHQTEMILVRAGCGKTGAATDQEDRLKEMVDECRRICNNDGVTGFNEVNIIDYDYSPTDKSRHYYGCNMVWELKNYLASAASTPGSTTASTFTIDELTVNTSIAGTPTADLGATDVTGQFTVSSGATIQVAQATEDAVILTRPSSNVGHQCVLSWKLYNDSNVFEEYGQMAAEIVTATDGSEDGQLNFLVMDGGTMTERATLSKDGDLDIDGSLTHSGALNLKPSGDADDYIQLLTTSDVPQMKRIGGQYVELLSDSATWAGLTIKDENGNYGRLRYHKTNHQIEIETDGEINFKPSGDTDDYLQFYTSGGIPYLKRIGGHDFRYETDHATVAEIQVFEDATNYVTLTFMKGTDKGRIHCTGDLYITADSDSDDYWYFSTDSNIASILPVEDKVHCIGSATLSADHVYSDDFDNTSPFEEFADPIKDLKKIKPNKDKTKLDYTSLPDFVRTHTRDPAKHVWGKKTVIETETLYDEEGNVTGTIDHEIEKDVIIERAPKDVIEPEGWSVNRMVMFLYQVIQKQQERIESLEAK